MKWRFMDIEEIDPHQAMALEEAVLESVSAGGAPVIHLWKWKTRAVTIGSFQNVDGEVYLNRCKKAGVPVIRRVSGGGTMFHAPEMEIVYSVCAPPGIISRDITESYRQMLSPLVGTLKDMGLSPGIDENNIMIGPHKISGSAQRRMAMAILHHGTILHDVNQYEMFSLIKGDKADTYIKGTCSNYKPVTCIMDHLDITLKGLAASVKEHLLEGKEWEGSEWTEDELDRANELLETRYSRDEWNLKL